MTHILTFSSRAVALKCVWVETGNPAQPLACRWVANPQAKHVAAAEPETAPEVARWPLRRA
jgi:hypothetical protein